MQSEPTERELEILKLLAQGCSNRRMVRILGLSPHTINLHLCKVYLRLKVHNRTGAVVEAHRLGYLNLRVSV